MRPPAVLERGAVSRFNRWLRSRCRCCRSRLRTAYLGRGGDRVSLDLLDMWPVGWGVVVGAGQLVVIISC